MSRASTSFILASFLLAWQWTTASAETVAHTLTDEEFSPSKCAFRIHDYDYNLCPLMETTAVAEEQSFAKGDGDHGEGSSVGRKLYEVALGGSPRRPHSTSSGLRLPGSHTIEGDCDEGTILCITEITRTTIPVKWLRFTRSKTALQTTTTPVVMRKNGEMKSSFSLSIDHSNIFPPVSSLEIKLLAEDEEQSVHLEMICSEAEVLTFLREHNGEFSFAWSTPHACPSRRSQQSIHTLEDGAPDGEAPAPEKGDQDLLPPRTNYRLRFWVSAVVVLIVFTTATIYAFLSSPRLRNSASEHLHAVSYTLLPLISQASTSLKPLKRSLTSLTPKSVSRLGSRFRQGDSQLVRWAQEDMSLEDADDLMVNGTDAPSGASGYRGNTWDEEGLDEYIPLTFGAKNGKARQVRSYGTTPDVETFAERGATGGFGRLFGR